jgi:molybdopterin molybdotransferase
VVAAFDVPMADRSAVDGFAVRHKEAVVGGRLRRAATLHAGDPSPKTSMAPGTCIQVATGALVPPGADAVAMVEDTTMHGDEVEFTRDAKAGQHVVAAGSDLAKGQVALKAGAEITPFRLAVAASLGVERLSVWRRPRISIHATGSEVRPMGAPLAPGQVYDSNAWGLRPILEASGAHVDVRGIVADTEADLEKALAASKDTDVIVLTGGSSAGERDLALPVLSRLGHGVRIKPGRPILVARLERRLVVVLPGFPASCLLDAHIFLKPALRRMAHRPEPPAFSLKARLGVAVSSPADKHHVVPVRIQEGVAWPTFHESGATTSLADAVGYFEIPEGETGRSQDALVDIHPF